MLLMCCLSTISSILSVFCPSRMMKEIIQYLLEIKRYEVMRYRFPPQAHRKISDDSDESDSDDDVVVDVDMSRLPEGMVLECTLDQVR